MDMTPQAYPLELTTEDGERYLVVGWIDRTLGEGGLRQPRWVPVAVPLDDVRVASPGVIEGAVQYRRPVDVPSSIRVRS